MPTMSTGKEIEKKMEEITTQIAEEMGIPTWGVITIIIGKSCFFPFFFVQQKRENLQTFFYLPTAVGDLYIYAKSDIYFYSFYS